MPSKGLQGPRHQRRTLALHPAVVGEQGIILDLVRQHAAVASVVTQPDTGRHLPVDGVNEGALGRLSRDRGRRHEQHAVGIHFDHPPAAGADGADDLPDDLLADPRHAVRGGIIAEQRNTEAELTIETVDQYLIGTLLRVQGAGLLTPGSRLHALLGVQAQTGEAPQQHLEKPEVVRFGMHVVVQHDRRVQAFHVGVDDGADDAGGKDVHVAAAHVPAGAAAAGRQGVLLPQIGAHHERLDLGGGAGAGHLAVRHRHHAGEVEGRAGEQAGEAFGLHHVVAGVLDEPLRVAMPDLRNVLTLHVRPVVRLQAEIARRRFQAVARQVALEDVEGHHLQIRVDDVAAGDVGAGQVHRALGKPHGGGKRARRRAVAADGEGHPVAGAAGGDVGQVEGVDVVPLDDVRVALPNRPHQPLQHVLFGQLAGVDDVVPAAVVAQRNDHDAVLGPLGVRKRPRL